MSGALAYREPCQGGNANCSLFDPLMGDNLAALCVRPPLGLCFGTEEGVPSLAFHRSITPPVPGVRVLTTA